MFKHRHLNIFLTLLFLVSLIAVFAMNIYPSFSLERQHSLILFTEPYDGRLPVVDAITAATKTIRVEMYLLTDEKIIASLKKASAKGVKVRILLESKPYEDKAAYQNTLRKFKDTAVVIKPSSPDFVFTHEKCIVIDDHAALIMTLNQSNSAFTKNREFGLINSHPEEVLEIIKVFEADWQRITPKFTEKNLVWSPHYSRPKIERLIKSAKKELSIYTEELKDKRIEGLLVRAARKKVNVRILTSPQKGMSYKHLTFKGIQIGLLKKPYIHAKAIIVDGKKAFIGSENLSSNSLDNNRELGMIFMDKKIIEKLQRTFEADWQNSEK